MAEVFATAWRRFPDIPADRELPWMYGVARNVVLNFRRSQVRRDRMIQRYVNHAATSLNGKSDDGLDDVRLERLQIGLDHLGEPELELLRLAVWERLTHAEIALAMECSENAVAIRLHRIRKKLAVAVEGEGVGSQVGESLPESGPGA